MKFYPGEFTFIGRNCYKLIIVNKRVFKSLHVCVED